MRIELRRNVRIELNRKVPQTNRLSLGVLDMDARFEPVLLYPEASALTKRPPHLHNLPYICIMSML